MIPPPPAALIFREVKNVLLNGDPEILITRSLLLRLIDHYICSWDFDEDWYRRAYPDIKDAIDKGNYASGWAHFRETGYLEGRLPSEPIIDSEWYLSTYPDVAEAILNGKVESARDHYLQFGYSEGRLSVDPGIHPKWYASRYLVKSREASATTKECADHFVRHGYINIAIPKPPR